jgi:hypothetical protein
VNYPQITNLLPTDKQVYEIDLDSRTVSTPPFLSVQFDHNAEIIYFKCARYYDNMDLANTVCVIEYLNAEHLEGKKKVRNAGMFWVPYFDISHYDVEIDEKGEEVVTPIILIPWSIGGLATAYSGTVTFTVRFYKLSGDYATETEGRKYLYNMSTRPQDGEVLHGMDLSDEQLESFKLEASTVA